MRWSDGSLTRRECTEDRNQPRRGMLGTADHQAVPALRAPDTPARADVEIVNASARERRGAANVVFEMTVAAVDDRVALLEMFCECGDGLFRGIARGNHHPNGARRCQFRHEIGNRSGALRAAPSKRLNRPGVLIPDHDFVTAIEETARHVAAHAAQSHESYLHG